MSHWMLFPRIGAMVGTGTSPSARGELEGPGAACPAAGMWEERRGPPAPSGHRPCPQAACRTWHRQAPWFRWHCPPRCYCKRRSPLTAPCRCPESRAKPPGSTGGALPAAPGTLFPWRGAGAGAACPTLAAPSPRAGGGQPGGLQGSDTDRSLLPPAQQGHSSTPSAACTPPRPQLLLPPSPKLHPPSTSQFFTEIQH